MVTAKDISTLQRPTQKMGTASEEDAIPGLLIATSMSMRHNARWIPLPNYLLIGRDEPGFEGRDQYLSSRHCEILRSDHGWNIIDVGSTNGTYLNGIEIKREEIRGLNDGDVIRLGKTLLVFYRDVKPYVKPPRDFCGFVGRFHSGPIIRDIRQAVIERRPILLAGPTGSGKELAARAIYQISKRKFIKQYNMARCATNDDASSMLFGVAPNRFTGVQAAPGLIEQSNGGVLFLDEFYTLPVEIQKQILRVVEDRVVERKGATRGASVDVLFVFASNEDPPRYGLAKDVLARLRIVTIPPLNERRADIPEIFTHLLAQRLDALGCEVAEVFSRLSTSNYEALCLDEFPDNVRGLIDIASRVASDVYEGRDPRVTIERLLAQRQRAQAKPLTGEHKKSTTVPMDETPLRRIGVSDDPVANNLDLIVRLYNETPGNISALYRSLKARGLNISRLRLARVLKDLGFYVQTKTRAETKRDLYD